MSKVMQTIKKRNQQPPLEGGSRTHFDLTLSIFQVSVMNTECLEIRRKSLQHVRRVLGGWPPPPRPWPLSSWPLFSLRTRWEDDPEACRAGSCPTLGALLFRMTSLPLRNPCPSLASLSSQAVGHTGSTRRQFTGWNGWHGTHRFGTCVPRSGIR